MAGWQGKTRGGTMGYQIFIFIIRYLGVRAAYAFTWVVIPYFIPFAPQATASTWRYARRILGYGRWRSLGLLLRNYYRVAQITIDRLALRYGMKDRYRFVFEGYDEFLEVLNSGEGVVMMGAHVGNWELGTPFFDHYGKKINIVMYDAEHQRIKQMLQKSALQSEFKIIPVNADNLTHVFRITEALSNREYVCFQGDRYVNTEKVSVCDFMGHPARFPSGPFLLASRLKTPVVFYFALREPGYCYRFHFTLLHPDRAPQGVSPEQYVLHQYVQTLEQVVRRYPEQWFNYYRFWG